ncbi:uncharacterized protein N7529_010947 [Penicillium soppii]|uniref:uncharacterized protein n=1 Tax=Penicillium soppii TaxID=69789 RepID=UPI00254867F4|nr:uncharacterized protein N7529_010947 [Penicillium soppii]KAJ5851562.1 hypothetical protein N7529_010947 [Penicillium soppii]
MANASQPLLPAMNYPQLRRTSTAIRVVQEEFNIQSPQRKIILRHLKEALLGQEVPAPFWAVIQLCDLSKLEYLVQLAHLSLKIMDIIADLTCSLPYKWTQRPSPFRDVSMAAFTTDPQHPTSGRSIARWRPIPPGSKYDARQRDQYKCVITGARQVYHSTTIFPTAASTSSLHDDVDFPSLWRFVDIFWGKSTAERWRKAVFSNRKDAQLPVDDCSNLICLRDDIRSAWSKGLLALRPFWKSDDNTKLDIEFYWQPKNDHKPYDLIDVVKEPISSKDAESVEQLNVVVPQRGGRKYKDKDKDSEGDSPNVLSPIKSGYRFRMTTDDPVARPLPNFDLLDMQWHFSRMVAFSNAAAIFPHDDHDDDEDEDDDEDAKTARPDYHKHRGLRIYLEPPDIVGWVEESSTFSSSHSNLDYDDVVENDCSAADYIETDYIEDIDASMIGPMPGAEAGGVQSGSQRSVSSGSLGSLDDSVRAFGHLSIDL